MPENRRFALPLSHPPLAAQLERLPEDRLNWLISAAGWEIRDGQIAPGAAQAHYDAALWTEIVADLLSRQASPAPELAARLPQIALRADSRLRAACETAPTERGAAVALEDQNEPYAGYFALELIKLRHPLHEGGQTQTLRREVLTSGDACVVLPYDPKRDRVLLLEQFRPGVCLRGDLDPWLIETVAGRIDAGETPQSTALREAEEEAGITLTELIPLPGHYPSPAALTEYVYGFIGLADLPEGTERPSGGLAEEGEDIRTLTVPLSEAMDMLAAGKLRNGPLIVALLWLSAHRDDIQARLGA